ncbi:MAG: hypothetical protein JWR67_2125, partial [Mucilaginibacter sp.]|nr:hypothetical protein [Mucilaginibacter sp.]
NSAPAGSTEQSTSISHGGFDDDHATVNATFGRMLNESSVQVNIEFKSSASHLAYRRHQLSN